MGITVQYLASLRDDLVARRIGEGIRKLEQCRELLGHLDPQQENAAAFVGQLAQWVDVGFGSHQQVRKLLDLFPAAVRSALSLRDYVHLRMAEGLIEMSDERTASALRHYEFVLSVANDVDDQSMIAIAHFWTGRCYRKSGRYDEATVAGQRAIEIARALGYSRMVAIMQVMESWLLFQKGRSTDAVRILKEAEAALSSTDDYISLGNIHSAYGRISRRDGKYDQAIAHGARAVEEYRKHRSPHRNLARALAN
ncbi:MAG: tetratricopeptide repeat protein, partial [Bryobacteraceae bacterium]